MTSFQQHIKQLPLKRKLFIGTSLGVLLVVAVSSMVLFGTLHTSINRDIKRHLFERTASIRDLVRTSVETTIRNYLRAIAEKDLEIVSYYHSLSQQGIMSEDEARSQAAEILMNQTIGQSGYVFCLNSQGIMQIHPKEEMQGADVKKYPFSKVQIERKYGYHEYEWANPDEPQPRAKALYMTYFAPWDWIISVTSYREEFEGLVHLDDFRESVLAHSIGETGYSFIMDAAGTLVIHPKLEGVNVVTMTDPMGNAFPVEILGGESGTVEYDWINPGETKYRKKIAVFDTIPELGWTVASTGYLDEIESPLYLLRSIIAGSTAIMLFLLFIMSWWVARVATRPFPPLIQAFEQGEHGNLSLRMDEDLGGEFGQLAVFYNRFMDRLEASRGRLIESEEKYRAIFEQAVEGMFQLHPDGSFLNINPAMAHIFGYESPNEMMREVGNVEQLYADTTDRDELYRELFDNGKVVGASLRLLRRDNSIFWGEISERIVLDKTGEMTLVEGILKDVTGQHDFMESLAKAKESAETASQLKSDFLVMISHEMRTPLTSMLGFSRIVNKQLQSKVLSRLESANAGVTETVRRAIENLDIVETESTRLADLIDNMMDFARLEAGEALLCIKSVAPKDLAMRAMESIADIAEAKGLSAVLEVEEHLPNLVVDNERIAQVLVHLLNNAVKFTPAGGVVTLTATMSDSDIEFAVTDTGSGIPPESIERVFDHFTQLGDVITDKPQGTGLGLALCRSIVSLHRGRIWVESKPGQGSTFRFTLPLIERQGLEESGCILE